MREQSAIPRVAERCDRGQWLPTGGADRRSPFAGRRASQLALMEAGLVDAALGLEPSSPRPSPSPPPPAPSPPCAPLPPHAESSEPKADHHCELPPLTDDGARTHCDTDTNTNTNNSHTHTHTHTDYGLDPLSLCRVCMAPTTSVSVFRICEKVMSCAAVQISHDDGLPERVCAACVADLEVAFNFKTRCERSDALLRDKLGLKTKTIVKTEFVLIDCDLNEDLGANDRATRRSRAKKRIGDDFIEEEDFSVQETDDPSYETLPKKRKMRRKRKSLVSKSKPPKLKKPKEESEDDDDDDDDVVLVPRSSDVPPKKRKSYPCPHCDKTFPYPSVLKVHAVIHTKKKEHKCVLCPEAFVYTKELYAHYKLSHPNETGKPAVEDSPKTFPCRMCDKVFGENKNLKVHEAMHMREKKYTCDGCSLGFTNMTVLNNHKKMEHPELCRPYACNVCNRSFKMQSALERHVDCHKLSESTRINEAKKPPLVKDLFKSIAPLTTTYWSDSFSD